MEMDSGRKSRRKGKEIATHDIYAQGTSRSHIWLVLKKNIQRRDRWKSSLR